MNDLKTNQRFTYDFDGSIIMQKGIDDIEN